MYLGNEEVMILLTHVCPMQKQGEAGERRDLFSRHSSTFSYRVVPGNNNQNKWELTS